MAEMDIAAPVEQQQNLTTDNTLSTPVESQAAQTSASSPNTSQMDVDLVAKRIRQESYEKGRREALAEFQRSQQGQPSFSPSPSSTPMQTTPMGGMMQVSQDQLNQLIDQRTNELRQHDVARQIANDFISKVSQGSKKYSDFDQVVSDTFGDFGEAGFAEIAKQANGVDNTADVIYELAKNPAKIAEILSFLQHSPRLAGVHLQSLSRSIKQNEDALGQSTAQKPLSQIQPSLAGMGNGGEMSIDELRMQDWMRV